MGSPLIVRSDMEAAALHCLICRERDGRVAARRVVFMKGAQVGGTECGNN